MLGAASFSLSSMAFGGDTSYQTLAEYIGSLLRLIIAVVRGWDTSAVVPLGDSTIALTWGVSGRFRSNKVINAATVCVVLRGRNEISLVGSAQTTSEENRVPDVLSR